VPPRARDDRALAPPGPGPGLDGGPLCVPEHPPLPTQTETFFRFAEKKRVPTRPPQGPWESGFKAGTRRHKGVVVVDPARVDCRPVTCMGAVVFSHGFPCLGTREPRVPPCTTRSRGARGGTPCGLGAGPSPTVIVTSPAPVRAAGAVHGGRGPRARGEARSSPGDPPLAPSRLLLLLTPRRPLR